jgi:catechol 2,3-dioxygenase-like lactoylglutathione lyase family enzyme
MRNFLSGILLAAVPMFGQVVLPPNSAGVSAGHEHMTVPAKDMEQFNKFWTAFGGRAIQRGNSTTFAFPGVYVMAIAGDPKGGTEGTTVEYLQFKVKSMKESMARWEANGLKPLPGATATEAYFMATSDVKLHVTEDKALASPIAMDLVKMDVPNVAEAQAWYAKNFGAKLVKHGNDMVGDIPGSYLLFTEAKGTPTTTRGHGLTHLGFEVQGLEAFCKKLEGEGLKLDMTYRKTGSMGVCFATDPWGTYLELNEGFATLEKQ